MRRRGRGADLGSSALIGVALALCVGSFVLQQSLIVPVLPTIQHEYGVDAVTVSWVLTAYMLSAAVLTPLIGRLGDDFGLQKTLLVSMLLMTLGCLAAAIATSIHWLILARVIQGAGGASVPLCFALVRECYPLDAVSSTIAWLASLTSVAFGAGIVAAGPLATYLGYTAIYWFPVALCAAAALSVALFLPPSRHSIRPSLPIVAAGWLSLGLSCLLLVIANGPRWGWTSGRTWAAVACALVGFSLWLRKDKAARTPLIDLALLAQRGVWSTSLLALALGFGNLAAWAFLSQFVQVGTSTGFGLGISEVEAGLFLVPMAFTSFVAGSGSARVQRAVGPRLCIVLGCSIGGVGYGALAVSHGEIWQVLLATGLVGLGSGLVYSTMTTVLILSVPPDQTGVASGLNYNVRAMSGALGATVLGVLLGSHPAGTYPAESRFVAGFCVLAVVLFLGALAAFLLPRRKAAHVVDEHGLVPFASELD